MANSADPDQLASEEANFSGSAMFTKAGHIQVCSLCSAAVLVDSHSYFSDRKY